MYNELSQGNNKGVTNVTLNNKFSVKCYKYSVFSGQYGTADPQDPIFVNQGMDM